MTNSYLKRGFGFLLVVLCLGILHGPATAGDGAYRLLYLFDPAVAIQASRAADLGDRVAGRPEIYVIGIVRGELANILSVDSGVGSELPYEILTVSEAVKRGGPVHSEEARLWLSRIYQQAGDFVAIDNGAALVVTGTGDDFDEVVGTFLNLPRTAIRTEVDFSTWGKVKELFR